MIIPRLLALGLAGTILCSCGSSQPTRFYTLAAADNAGAASTRQVIPVTVGDVDLPQIVDKPQLVRRLSPDQISLLEFDRWASPLEDNTRKIFTIDLGNALPPGSVIRSDGSPYDTSIAVIDLDVDRFDADTTGHVTLDASWSLTRGNPQQTILRRSEQVSVDSANASTAAMVAGMSQAVNELAGRVAAQLPAK